MSNAEEIEEPLDEPEAAKKGPKLGKKKLIIVASAVALLLGGGGGAYLAFGGEKAPAGEEKHGEKAAGGHGKEGEGEGEGEGYIDVPAIIVNLRSADGAPHFLKIHFMLIPAPSANAEEVKKNVPLLLDAYQPFLRELRPEDLAGSAAVFRIKEEMLIRATSALGPDQVSDVLIQDLIQQ